MKLGNMKKLLLFLCFCLIVAGLHPANTDLLKKGYQAAAAFEDTITGEEYDLGGQTVESNDYPLETVSSGDYDLGQTVGADEYPLQTVSSDTYPVGGSIASDSYPLETVGSNDYPLNTIGSSDYPLNTIGSGDYPLDTIGSSDYPVNTIGSNDYSLDTISSGTYDTGTIGSGTYPAGTIGAADYPLDTINSGTYDAGTIGSGSYPAGTIDNSSYPVNTIGSSSYPVDTIGSSSYPIDSISSGSYPVDTIGSSSYDLPSWSELTAGSYPVDTINSGSYDLPSWSELTEGSYPVDSITSGTYNLPSWTELTSGSYPIDTISSGSYDLPSGSQITDGTYPIDTISSGSYPLETISSGSYPLPNPAPRPQVAYVSYLCEGYNEVFYRFYDDGSKIATGQVNPNSYMCGYIPSLGEVRSTTPQSGTTTTTVSGTTFQSPVYEVQRYPECSNSGPGMVRDVIQYSDGTYKTYNEHFQAGVCGTWEGPGCWGSHSVWGVWTNDGTRLIQMERDYGVKAGECNNPYPHQTTQTSGSTQSSGSSSSGSSSTAQGGNVTVNVRTASSNPEERNYPTLSVSCAVTPSNPKVGDPVTWRAMPTGGSGDFTYRWIGGDPPLTGRTFSPAMVTYNTSGLKTGEVRVFDRKTNEDVYARCSVEVQPLTQSPSPTVTPTPTPSVTPTPTPTVAATASPTVVVASRCPDGTVEIRRSAAGLVCERPTTTVTNTTQTGSTGSTQSTAPAAVSAGAAPGAGQQTIVTPVQQPVTVTGQEAISIKELPRTGLPLAGVALGSLTPLGLRIRRAGRKTEVLTAATIWSERQFKL